MTLADKVAAQREAKAATADRWAAVHGANTVHGKAYRMEAAAWREGAAKARAGDLTPLVLA